MHRNMQLHCSLSGQTAVSLTSGLSHGSRSREEGGVKEERFGASKKVGYGVLAEVLRLPDALHAMKSVLQLAAQI
jgi:hypothetical protein